MTRLEEIRGRYPRWRIEKAAGRHVIGYTADQGTRHLYSPHLTGLEAKLAEAEGRQP